MHLKHHHLFRILQSQTLNLNCYILIILITINHWDYYLNWMGDTRRDFLSWYFENNLENSVKRVFEKKFDKKRVLFSSIGIFSVWNSIGSAYNVMRMSVYCRIRKILGTFLILMGSDWPVSTTPSKELSLSLLTRRNFLSDIFPFESTILKTKQ